MTIGNIKFDGIKPSMKGNAVWMKHRGSTRRRLNKCKCTHGLNASYAYAPCVNGQLKRSRRHAMGLLSSLLALEINLAHPGKGVAEEVIAETFESNAEAPQGSKVYEDVYDHYSVSIPSGWIPVTTAGADVFFRNTYNVEQNLFVTISSKSFSKYDSLAGDIGTPEAAGELWLRKYLGEFMSTRLGIVRNGSVVSTSEREDSSGHKFYDILLNLSSYAATNQYGISSKERPQSKEWDRYFLTTIGISDKRLFELRLQCSVSDYEQDRDKLLSVLHSFKIA